MFAPGGGKRLECALHNPLTADVDPGAGGHLSVHGEAHALEPIELRVVVPLSDEIRIRNQDTRRFVVGSEFSHRLSRLHKKRLVIFEIAQGSENRIEGFPAPRGAPRSAINDESVRGFGYIGIEIVHQHPHGRFLMPAFAGSLGAARCADVSFFAHHSSSLSKSPRRIASATRAISLESGRSCVSGGAIFLTAAKARSTPAPALRGRRCSRASAPASNSIASKFSAKSTIARSFNAPVMPMATWSSFPADVGTLSTLDGCARTFASFSNATAATCAIMNPDFIPGCWARNAGKPSFMSGFNSRSIRRSLMLIKSVRAMAA